MNHEVPQKNTNKESKKGMYSTLLVFITNLCNFDTIQIMKWYLREIKLIKSKLLGFLLLTDFAVFYL